MSHFIADPVIRNPSQNTPFGTIVQEHISRRSAIGGALASAFTLFASSSPLARALASADPDRADTPVTLGFQSLPVSMTDACVVPPGYTCTVLGAWGEPLDDQAAPWRNDGKNSSQDLLHSTGMHHDGMHYFPLDGSSSEGLLVVNHEYIDEAALHPNGPTTPDGKRPAEEVRKEINAHGVSIMHIRKRETMWDIVRNSRYNRRFTAATVMDIAGPLAGKDALKTPFSPDGTQTRGTQNNCGNGTTPWGTYMTAEENWAASFVHRGELLAHQKRSGISSKRGRYQWETAAGDASEEAGEFARFDITPGGKDTLSDWRNEANGFGYMVEIDPYAPGSRAVKRTALGRFAHESSAYGNPIKGQPLAFYMGDDSRFEYVYRFVSDALWEPQDASPNAQNRRAIGDKYLNHGTLYVARFNADGTGEWLPLTPDARAQDGRTLGELFGSLDAILLDTRSAADAVGATPMDRPEWNAVHPTNGDVYVTLTNNTRRSADNTNAPNPRANNANGHIVRWHDDAGSNRFVWDIFVFGAHAAADADTNRSGLTEANQLASPDGIAFDERGILWIDTDNGIDSGRHNDVARTVNDQVLAVIPAPLAARADPAQPAIHAGNQADLRRFFVGPNEAEITGFAYTPDHRTIFLNVQHPANWPAYATRDATAIPTGKVRPRSATVVIQKRDGGAVGE